MHTKERLAEALEQAGLPDLAAKARQGLYDDFESPLAMPKFELVKLLRMEGEAEFAERVASGEFDNTKEESDEWMKSPEGQAALAKLTTR